MPADFTKLTVPLFFAVVMMFVLYRRVRANIGRQRLRNNRLAVRMTLLTLVSGLLLFSHFPTLTGLLYTVVGAGLGGGFAVYALRHTKFEITPEGTFYTPHLYIGLAVIALLIGRMALRIFQNSQNAGAVPKQDPFAAMVASPLTLGIMFLMIGYYLVYFAGLYREGRRRQTPAGSET